MAQLDLTPTTELEAVNAILASVGEAPVVSLDGLFVDAELAQQLLHQSSRGLQTRGWVWNTDTDVVLVRDNVGQIPVPSDVLRLVCGSEPTAVVRQNKLYDRARQSFVFPADVTVDKLVRFLPFEDIPEAARAFVTARAGRRFQDRHQGSEALHRFQERDELSAWAALLDYEAEIADYNLVGSSLTIQRIKARRPA